MHRDQWKAVARARLSDAKVLLDAGQWSGAYYVSGYAIECGLKASLVRQFQPLTLPTPKFVRDSYTHSLQELVKLAGLQSSLSQATANDVDFAANWATVKDWSETSRYELTVQAEAEAMYAAIANRRHGVMKWVRSQW